MGPQFRKRSDTESFTDFVLDLLKHFDASEDELEYRRR